MENNHIVGEIGNARVSFRGEGNLLVVEDGAKIDSSAFLFAGSNALVYVRASSYKTALYLHVFNDSVVCLDSGCSINGKLTISASEHQHVVIGRNCLFARDVTIRTSDVHLIYGIEGDERLNFPSSVFIGDHVWIGERTSVFKGTTVSSGSVIGAGSVVAGKRIPHNTIWAGNPVRQIKSGIYWDPTSSHAFSEQDSQRFSDFSELKTRRNRPDRAVFSPPSELLTPQLLAEELSRGSAQEKLEYLQLYLRERDTNSFAWL